MPGSAIDFRETVRAFSDELVALQQPIRILDAIAWGDDVAADFFAAGCTRQPDVDAEYYATRRPLRFEPDEVRAGLTELRGRISRQLGAAPIEGLLVARIDEYLRVIDLLEARGTPTFSPIAAELYGGSDDQLHPGGPTLADLGVLMDDALTSIDLGIW